MIMMDNTSSAEMVGDVVELALFGTLSLYCLFLCLRFVFNGRLRVKLIVWNGGFQIVLFLILFATIRTWLIIVKGNVWDGFRRTVNLKRLEPLADSLYLWTVARCLLFFISATGQLGVKHERLGILIGFVMISDMTCSIALCIIPGKLLKSMIMIYVHSILAASCFVVVMVHLVVYRKIRRAALRVPVHQSILQQILGKISCLVVTNCFGLCMFGFVQLLLALREDDTLQSENHANALERISIQIITQYIPCAMITHYFRNSIPSPFHNNIVASLGRRMVPMPIEVPDDLNEPFLN